MSGQRAPGRYGRLPHDPGRPAIRLADILTGVVPPHPVAVDYLSRLGAWQMLGNDSTGDCVAVTWANTRRLVTATLAAEHYPTLDDVLAIYATQNPAGQDDGMSIQVLLEYLATTPGPDGSKIVAFAKVDHTAAAEVQAAIAIFGSVWTGITVLQANETEFAQDQPWDYVPGSPAAGGHSVITGGYGGGGYGQLGGAERFITWAAETSFTETFWQREVDECWAVIWPEHLGTAEFEAGVDVAALAADYQQLTGRPLPVPVAPPPVPVPVPVDPGVVDETLAVQAAGWVRRPHVGPNAQMAAGLRTWMTARQLP